MHSGVECIVVLLIYDNTGMYFECVCVCVCVHTGQAEKNTLEFEHATFGFTLLVQRSYAVLPTELRGQVGSHE